MIDGTPSGGWIGQSQPDPEDRQAAAAAGQEPQTLRDWLIAYKGSATNPDGSTGISNGKLAQMLGYSPAVVSQYLSAGGNKYTGDTARLERRIADLKRRSENEFLVGVPLIETSVTQQVADMIENIRRTNQIGLIFGDAGIGKSVGVELYQRDNPTCICITLTEWRRDRTSVERMVFEACGFGDWPGNTSRSDFISRKLKGSGRPIVVDNAHKATRAGLQWFFDLHDETKCPIALVGNEDITKAIFDNDQRFSRVGFKDTASTARADKLIKHMIRQFAPDAVEELVSLAEQVVEKRGHFRALAMQLSLAARIKENSTALTWAKAFAGAHLKLIRDYPLL